MNVSQVKEFLEETGYSSKSVLRNKGFWFWGGSDMKIILLHQYNLVRTCSSDLLLRAKTSNRHLVASCGQRTASQSEKSPANEQETLEKHYD